MCFTVSAVCKRLRLIRLNSSLTWCFALRTNHSLFATSDALHMLSICAPHMPQVLFDDTENHTVGIEFCLFILQRHILSHCHKYNLISYAEVVYIIISILNSCKQCDFQPKYVHIECKNYVYLNNSFFIAVFMYIHRWCMDIMLQLNPIKWLHTDYCPSGTCDTGRYRELN